MKKLRTVLFMTFFFLNVSASYSQFYDVKIIKPVKEVGTRREPTPHSVPENIVNAAEKIARAEKTNGKLSENQPKENVMNSKEMPSAPLFCAPLDTLIVSSAYGYRKDPFTGKRKFHAGTDYLTASENVYAMMPGRIKKIGYDKKLGNFITIDHGDLTVTYAHLHTVVGEKGETVGAGQSVGLSGSTGRSTGEHLHVSIRYKKDIVDPDPLIRVICEYAKISSESNKQ